MRSRVVHKLDPVRRLQTLRDATQRKILRKAVRAASGILRDALKQDAPRRTGATRISMGLKVVTYKARVMAIVGPRSKYTKTVKGRVFRPVKYLHIIEKRRPFMKQTL